MNTPVIGPGTITSFPGTATPEVPADWDYDKSVAVMVTHYRNWKSLTVELLSELYVARAVLSKPHSHESEWADYCEAIGIPKSTANQWLRRALVGTGSHTGDEEALMTSGSHEEVEEVASSSYPKAVFTGNEEWYTPPQFLEAVRDVLGGFDLDPASCDAAQKHVQAARYFDKEHDGLGFEWRGRVWLNPPYSQPAIGEFVSKLLAELHAGRVTEAVMLTHNYTDTAWFHEAQSAATAICFTRGRVKFVNPAGETAAPTQGQAFFYFGSNPAPFVARFSEIGFVVRPGHVGAER